MSFVVKYFFGLKSFLWHVMDLSNELFSIKNLPKTFYSYKLEHSDELDFSPHNIDFIVLSIQQLFHDYLHHNNNNVCPITL